MLLIYQNSRVFSIICRSFTVILLKEVKEKTSSFLELVLKYLKLIIVLGVNLFPSYAMQPDKSAPSAW